MRHLQSTSMVALGFVLMASPAMAQQHSDPRPMSDQAKPVPSDRTDPPLATSDQAMAADAAAGDIVVTATRSSTLASKTPVALTAVTGDSLIAAGVTNPTQISELVPNISIDRVNGLQITIRGVTSNDGTEKGDPSAAFMLDGIYIARPQAQETSFFDVNRVEVLRGPQGTLFGRNTTAGLINVITNRPTFEPGGRVDASYGNYGQTQVSGVVNVPVTQTFALRAAANYDARDSFIVAGPRVVTDLSPFKKNVSGRLSGLLDLGRGEIVIRGDYSHIGGRTANNVLTSNFFANYATGQTPLYIGSNRTSRTLRGLNVPITTGLARDNDTWGIEGEFNYDFGGVGIAYLGSYREFHRAEDAVALFGTGTRSIPTRFDGDYWQNSQELRVFTSGSGPLKAQAGAYYFKEKSSVSYNLFGLLSPTPGVTGFVYGFPQSPTISESYAGFGQVTWSIVDEVRLTGGVRYSHDDKSRVGKAVRCGTTACDLPTDTAIPNNAHRAFEKVTWRAGIDVDLDPRTLLFATVSTGYKAGGFNDGCEAGTPGCTSPLAAAALYYRPETLTAYEIGLKTRFLDNAVRINAAAFRYRYSDIQLTQVTDRCGGAVCTVTTNAAKAYVKGAELEGTIQPVRTTLFNISVAYLDAKYKSFQVTPAVSFAGRDLDRSPGLNVIAGFTQTFPLGNGGNVEANARTRVSDSYVLAALSSLNQFRVPGSTRTDLNLTYNAPDERYYVQGFVKNLENAVVVTSVSTGTFASVSFADPRTYGARLGFKF